MAQNVFIDEAKYILPNRVTCWDSRALRQILRGAFERWPIEDCFPEVEDGSREAKSELGLLQFKGRSSPVRELQLLPSL